MIKQKFNLEDIIGFNAPNNQDLEINLLSGIINRPSIIKDLETFISIDCFYDKTNRDVWSAIMNLYGIGKHIDSITVYSEAAKINPMITPFQIMTISSKASLFDKEILETAQLAKELDLRRKLQSNAVNTLMRVVSNEDVDDIMSDCENNIKNISNSIVSNTTTLELREVLMKAELEMKYRIENKGNFGIKSGITGLDTMTGGFKNTELIVVGARPGMGKTAFALTVARKASENGASLAIFSLEMDSTRLADRMTIAKSGVDAYNFRNGYLDASDVNKVFKANEELSKMNMWIDDKANQSINYIRSVCRKLKKSKKGLDMVIIDYLQLIEVSDSQKDTRERIIADISRGLKMLAKELKIPVMLLCQLNRSVELRADKKPIMSDLRESGAIEQDADVVIFLLNPHKYTELDEDKNRFIITVAKQREGAIGDTECWRNDSLTIIRDATDGSPEFFQGSKDTPF